MGDPSEKIVDSSADRAAPGIAYSTYILHTGTSYDTNVFDRNYLNNIYFSEGYSSRSIYYVLGQRNGPAGIKFPPVSKALIIM